MVVKGQRSQNKAIAKQQEVHELRESDFRELLRQNYNAGSTENV